MPLVEVDNVRPSWPKNGFVYLLILVAVIALFYSFFAPGDNVREIALSQVADYVQQGKVKSLSVK